MTKQANIPDANNEILTRKELATEYLLEHPSFLIDNPDLLTQIQVQPQEKGVVSLTQIQASQAREKIRLLKAQVDEMVSNARQNEVIYKTYAELNLDLAKASSMKELEESLANHLINTLGLETANLVLINGQDTNQNKLSEIQQRSLFDKKLARQPFYFGRLGNIEKEALFPNAQAQSVALVLLNEHDDDNKKPSPVGLLAISSKDPLHFQPDMDTVLLDYLRKTLNFHLSRLR